MYLISNRLADQKSGPLGMLHAQPNTRDPLIVHTYVVSRGPLNEWWLDLSFTLENLDRPQGPFGMRDNSNTSLLSTAFQKVSHELQRRIAPGGKPLLYMFSGCNANPKDTLERGSFIELTQGVIPVIFSCPVDRRSHFVARRSAHPNRRGDDSSTG